MTWGDRTRQGPRRTTGAVCGALLVITAACGTDAPSSKGSTPLPATATASPSTDAAAPSTLPMGTVAVDVSVCADESACPVPSVEVAATAAGPALGESVTIETQLGSVTYTPPIGVEPHPVLRGGNLPDFVLASDPWFLPGCCNVIVTLQDGDPPMPGDERVDSFAANDIEWRVYDTGPRDGSTVVAIGTRGPITVLVSTQHTFGEPRATPTQAMTEAVARSVTVDLADSCALGPVAEIGSGISVALPTDATFVEGGSTVDPPPPASVAYEYDVRGERLAVGRRLGMSTVVGVGGESSRSSGDAILYVVSDDAALRDCVLASMSYDPSRDT